MTKLIKLLVFVLALNAASSLKFVTYGIREENDKELNSQIVFTDPTNGFEMHSIDFEWYAQEGQYFTQIEIGSNSFSEVDFSEYETVELYKRWFMVQLVDHQSVSILAQFKVYGFENVTEGTLPVNTKAVKQTRLYSQ